MQSPYALGNDALYRRWRAWKLENYPVRTESVVVEVRDPRNPSPIEMQELLRVCRKANMAIYRSRLGGDIDKDIPRRLGAHFGLHHLDSNLLADEDSITSIEVVPGKSGRGYIPYSNRRLLWHTDGYYNPGAHRIRAFLLHCVQPAAEGGENALFDPEIAYIRLRDADPDYAHALMAPDAMTIPPNTEAGAERPASIGPVFAIDSMGGNLHMRYTARVRSILWKDDATTVAAVRFLEQLLADDSSSVFRYRLAAGEGLLCNNVLHNRTAFSDKERSDARRLLYRARYYDRIVGTNMSEIFGS
mgnify:FL=1